MRHRTNIHIPPKVLLIAAACALALVAVLVAANLLWRLTASFTPTELRWLVVGLILGYPAAIAAAYAYAHWLARQVVEAFNHGVRSMSSAASAIASLRPHGHRPPPSAARASAPTLISRPALPAPTIRYVSADESAPVEEI